MPRKKPLPDKMMVQVRAIARARLVAFYRARGDIEGVEILLGRRLPEIERWAICDRRNR